MDCCNQKIEKKQSGFFRGLCYGLLPHTFCIAFAVFAVLGSTALMTVLRPFLLNAYFFYFLVALSFVFATLSAVIYLKKNGILSLNGMKRKWKYLTVLYSTTIAVNLLFFLVIFPILANFSFSRNQSAAVAGVPLSSVTIGVAIPCSGHAPLIITELSKMDGFVDAKFKLPNVFEVTYDASKTSPTKLISSDIFKEYQATILK
ncbi:MAG: hypothetical protein ABH841_00450 [Candidatus Nealsonbacteria bacterium]